MLTLTAPHVGSTEERIDVLFEAWRDFSLSLQAYWRERTATFSNERRHWYRFFEWTPGADMLGHPHFHLWIWSDWLDVEDVRAWWLDALEAQGIEVERDEITAEVTRANLLVDLRLIDTRPEEISRELSKTGGPVRLSRVGTELAEYADGWSVVEYEQGERIAPEVAAAVYRALERRRVAQGSSGFLGAAKRCGCGACGARAVAVYLGHYDDDLQDAGVLLALWRKRPEEPPRAPPWTRHYPPGPPMTAERARAVVQRIHLFSARLRAPIGRA